MPSGSQAASSSRPLRTDARRNSERIIAVARAAFAELGPHAPLDVIARRAEVGPGTLYRRFPTREHLVEAVYWPDVQALTKSADEYRSRFEMGDGFERWIEDEYVPMQDEPAIGAVLQNALTRAPDVFSEGKEQFIAAVGALFTRAVDAGAVRRDVHARDVLRMAYGIVAASRDDPDARARMLTVMFDGLRILRQ